MLRVAIIGGGVSGIAAAVALKDIDSVSCRIFEKAERFGGTWRANTYPGVACDLPSRYYNFSFSLGHDWRKNMASGEQVLTYVESVARKAALDDLATLSANVTALTWRDGVWHLSFSDGTTAEADVVISATGFLRVPKKPSFPGLDDFDGPVFHTSEWDHTFEAKGKRIAVIGTGATAIQIVSSLREIAEHISLFQRTASWILPLPVREYTKIGRRIFQRSPFLQRVAYHAHRLMWEALLEGAIHPGMTRRLLEAACKWHLRLAVRDRELRRKLTPDYPPLCRRGLISSSFYRSFRGGRVELVDSAIDRMTHDSVVTSDGMHHRVDGIILATGFDAQAYLRPMAVHGVDGRDLDEVWRDGAFAHLSITVPGFPNLFLMQGPYSPTGNQSTIAAAEIQAGYIAQCVALLASGRFSQLEVTPAAMRSFVTEARRALPRTVWASGCRSYHLGPDGVPIMWPWSPSEYRRRLRTPNLRDFVTARSDRASIESLSP
ncbi:flavin-containing monooxygenase [Mycobacterium syngnathidarum]